MTLLLEEPTAEDEHDAQLLFKEARRRRRRLRTIWIAIAMAVVVATVGLGLSFHLSSSSFNRSAGITAQPAWPPHQRTGATLVYALNDLRVLDADSGRSQVLPLPAPYGGSRDLAMVSVGHSLVLNRGDTAWLYTRGFNSEPLDLGPSDGVFRGPTSKEAWIWSQPCQPIIGCTNYNAPQMGSVRLIDSSGRQIGPAVALPGDFGWYPTGIVGTAGMVLSELPSYGDHANQQEIWNPQTRRIIRVHANEAVMGARGNTVVWESTAPYCSTGCSVHVLNTQTGSERSVQLPPHVTATGDAAISPDGSTIAITGALGGTFPRSIPSGDPLHWHAGSRSKGIGRLTAADQSQPWADVSHVVKQRLVVFLNCWHCDSSCLATAGESGQSASKVEASQYHAPRQ